MAIRILILLAVLVDCGVPGRAPEPPSQGGPDVVAVPAPPPAASDLTARSASGERAAEAPDGGAKVCGCRLCEPVVSEDACTKDEDCAPAVPCHATRCVARAKATPKTPGTVCTMSLACDSVDVNVCGCRAGRCALSPRG